MVKQGARSGGWGVWAATVILLGVVGTVAGLAWRRMNPHTPIARALAYMPRDVAVVSAMDLAALRGHASLRPSRDRALADPDVRRGVAEMRAACGFDPVESVESVAFGTLPSAPGAREPVIAFVGVQAPRGALERCVRWANTRQGSGRALAPTTAIEGHTAFALTVALPGYEDPAPSAGPGGSPAGRDELVLVVLDDGLLFAERGLAQRALTPSGRRAGPDRLTALERVGEARAGGTLLFAAADFVALRGANPTRFAVSTGLAGVAVPWLTYVNTAQLAAFSVGQSSRGLRARSVVTLPTPVEAQAAAVSFTSWWGGARSLVTLGLGVMGAQLNSASASAVAANPALSVEVPRAQAALQLGLSVLNRVSPQAVDSQVRFDVELTTAELQTLSEGANAAVTLSNAGVSAPSPGVGGSSLVF